MGGWVTGLLGAWTPLLWLIVGAITLVHLLAVRFGDRFVSG